MMNAKHSFRFFSVALCALFFLPLAAQNNAPAQIRVSALNGSSGLGMAYMFENPPVIAGKTVQFDSAAAPDILLPRLLKGETDIGILPPNVAAKVYTANKGALVMGAVVGNGMLNLVTRDPDVTTLASLTGKKVVVAGQGATPEYVFRYLLREAGLENKVELDFSIPTAEIAALLAAGKIQYAVVPEPFATVAIRQNSALRRALNLQELWADINGNPPTYPMTVVVIRKEFAQKYPAAVRSFLTEYQKSIAWTNANPEQAGTLVQKFMLGLNAPIAQAAIPNCSFTFVPAAAARPSVEQLLKLFLQFAPQSIGGKLPDDGFYFK